MTKKKMNKNEFSLILTRNSFKITWALLSSVKSVKISNFKGEINAGSDEETKKSLISLLKAAL